VTPKTCNFRGFGDSKNYHFFKISALYKSFTYLLTYLLTYSFDRIVLIFGYIVERTNTMTSFPVLQKLS